jgi:hypothetical protein
MTYPLTLPQAISLIRRGTCLHGVDNSTMGAQALNQPSGDLAQKPRWSRIDLIAVQATPLGIA